MPPASGDTDGFLKADVAPVQAWLGLCYKYSCCGTTMITVGAEYYVSRVIVVTGHCVAPRQNSEYPLGYG